MTRTERRAAVAVLALLVASLLPAAGCLDTGAAPSSGPRESKAAEQIVRSGAAGPVVVVFTSHPLQPGAPPDGVRAALLRALGGEECSAAAFHWPERTRSMRWIQEQLDARRTRGRTPRLILAGHGLGATEAAETAREIMFGERDAEIVLLATVDAVKTSRIGGAAGVTGNAIARRIPGVDLNFTAYDAAPEPGNRRLWTHVNYYQAKSANLHGSPMPYAENHRIDDWTGLLNHGNADDFALPFLVADFREALRRADGPPLPPARAREVR